MGFGEGSVNVPFNMGDRGATFTRPSAQGQVYQSSLGKEILEVKKPRQDTKNSMTKHFEKKEI